MSDETPYTPSTTMVRLSYIASTKEDGDPDWTREGAKAEFTRWLDGEKAKAVADAEAQQAQIATQEPAGATQGGSGDSRASGGLGERLRALGTGQTRTLRKAMRAMADEVDVLVEKHARQAQTIGELQVVRERLTRQVERVRALITHYTSQGDAAVALCGLVAERMQAALDGKDTP